jgi:hypothetical protein
LEYILEVLEYILEVLEYILEVLEYILEVLEYILEVLEYIPELVKTILWVMGIEKESPLPVASSAMLPLKRSVKISPQHCCSLRHNKRSRG